MRRAGSEWKPPELIVAVVRVPNCTAPWPTECESKDMPSTYRRTRGLFALLTVTAVALAATVLTVAVAAIVLAVAVAAAVPVVLGRAVLPRSWRNPAVPTSTPWPHETIDTTAVTMIGSSDAPNLARTDGSPR